MLNLSERAIYIYIFFLLLLKLNVISPNYNICCPNRTQHGSYSLEPDFFKEEEKKNHQICNVLFSLSDYCSSSSELQIKCVMLDSWRKIPMHARKSEPDLLMWGASRRLKSYTDHFLISLRIKTRHGKSIRLCVQPSKAPFWVLWHHSSYRRRETWRIQGALHGDLGAQASEPRIRKMKSNLTWHCASGDQSRSDGWNTRSLVQTEVDVISIQGWKVLFFKKKGGTETFP